MPEIAGRRVVPVAVDRSGVRLVADEAAGANESEAGSKVCPPPMHDVRSRPDTRAATGSRKRTRHFYAFIAQRTSVSVRRVCRCRGRSRARRPGTGQAARRVRVKLGLPPEQPSDDGAEQLPRRASSVVEGGWHCVVLTPPPDHRTRSPAAVSGLRLLLSRELLLAHARSKSAQPVRLLAQCETPLSAVRSRVSPGGDQVQPASAN